MSDLEPAFNSFIGSRLSTIEHSGFVCIFSFENGSRVSVQTLWRIFLNDKIRVCSQDYGISFGGDPCNAVEAAEEILNGQEASEVILDKGCGDLIIKFRNQSVLQIIQTSMGYESWEVVGAKQLIICLGTGEVSIFDF